MGSDLSRRDFLELAAAGGTHAALRIPRRRATPGAIAAQASDASLPWYRRNRAHGCRPTSLRLTTRYDISWWRDQ